LDVCATLTIIRMQVILTVTSGKGQQYAYAIKVDDRVRYTEMCRCRMMGVAPIIAHGCGNATAHTHGACLRDSSRALALVPALKRGVFS
jgi:hypothetical protein